MRHTIFNIKFRNKILEYYFFNNIRYQMPIRIIQYLILLFQMFLKYQMATRVTRYLI